MKNEELEKYINEYEDALLYLYGRGISKILYYLY